MALIRKPAVALVAVVLLLAGCATNRYGPWTSPSGDILSNSIIVEFQGFEECGTQDVTFLRFLGKQYAYDPEGELGPLAAPNGTVLTYAEMESPPPGAKPTGVRHRDREIWTSEADVDEYLYVVYDGGFTQRWPRAETRCEPGARGGS